MIILARTLNEVAARETVAYLTDKHKSKEYAVFRDGKCYCVTFGSCPGMFQTEDSDFGRDAEAFLAGFEKGQSSSTSNTERANYHHGDWDL